MSTLRRRYVQVPGTSVSVSLRYPLHRIEFGPPKFFSKTCKFSIIFYSTLQFVGGGHFRKACRSRKKESKQSEITFKLSEPARTISKIQKRRDFVRALCCKQCPKNSFKRLYIVKGLLVLVEKASFSKEFRRGFQCGGEGYPLHRYEFGPPKFFSKTFQFSIIFYSTWQISGGGQ